MNAIDEFVEELIRKVEQIERHNILFYSTNRSRDFKVLDGKLKEYRDQYSKLKGVDGHKSNQQVGDQLGKKNL